MGQAIVPTDMVPARLPRVAVVTSLVLLGVSLGVFLSVAAGDPFAQPSRLVVDDDSLVVETGTERSTLLTDLGTVSELRLTTTDGIVTVAAERDRSKSIPPADKIHAKAVVAGSDTNVSTAGSSTLYSFFRVPRDVPSATVAATIASEHPRKALLDRTNESRFEARSAGPDTIRLRRSPSVFDRSRVGVAVQTLGTDVRYALVVDLETDTVESLVRLEDPRDARTATAERKSAVEPAPTRHAPTGAP